MHVVREHHISGCWGFLVQLASLRHSGHRERHRDRSHERQLGHHGRVQPGSWSSDASQARSPR